MTLTSRRRDGDKGVNEYPIAVWPESVCCKTRVSELVLCLSLVMMGCSNMDFGLSGTSWLTRSFLTQNADLVWVSLAEFVPEQVSSLLCTSPYWRYILKYINLPLFYRECHGWVMWPYMWTVPFTDESLTQCYTYMYVQHSYPTYCSIPLPASISWHTHIQTKPDDDIYGFLSLTTSFLFSLHSSPSVWLGTRHHWF